jgi:hypothetical protein
MSAGNEEFTAEFFTESSKAWMLNKKRQGASMAYICQGLYKNSEPCTRAATNFTVGNGIYCRIHVSQGVNSIINAYTEPVCLKGKKD